MARFFPHFPTGTCDTALLCLLGIFLAYPIGKHVGTLPRLRQPRLVVVEEAVAGASRVSEPTPAGTKEGEQF